VRYYRQEYPLHRLVLSRSPYFKALMRGPWADATACRLTLHFDDGLIDGDAVEARAASTKSPPPPPPFAKRKHSSLTHRIVLTQI
jgi:hypothetical protein